MINSDCRALCKISKRVDNLATRYWERNLARFELNMRFPQIFFIATAPAYGYSGDVSISAYTNEISPGNHQRSTPEAWQLSIAQYPKLRNNTDQVRLWST